MHRLVSIRTCTNDIDVSIACACVPLRVLIHSNFSSLGSPRTRNAVPQCSCPSNDIDGNCGVKTRQKCQALALATSIFSPADQPGNKCNCQPWRGSVADTELARWRYKTFKPLKTTDLFKRFLMPFGACEFRARPTGAIGCLLPGPE